MIADPSALRAPFPWFGGKSRVAPEIWARVGPVNNYVEPFCGSASMLLARPDALGVETINDADGFIANFWRAVRSAPDEVARWADYPVSEVDLIARNAWLQDQREGLTASLKADPEYHDPKIAGWWVWGQCAWIGSGWCYTRSEQLPHLGDPGMGINRKLPHLGDPGRGEYIRSLMERMSARLRDVRIACGDWRRVLGPSVTWRHGRTFVFLDPPYEALEHSVSYAANTARFGEVSAWASEAGENEVLAVVLCGYEGTWTPPARWSALRWRTAGGYGSQGNGRGRANREREVAWFSPGAAPRQGVLL